MDFVITEEFLHSLGNISESQISLFKSLGLFINKKASYVIGNYDIRSARDFNFTVGRTYANIKYLYNVIQQIYECSFDDNSYMKNLIVFGNGEEMNDTVCLIITIDSHANILSVSGINNTNKVPTVNNEYKNGSLVKSTKTKNVNDAIITTTNHYEYYDNGTLYKHIKHEYIMKKYTPSKIDIPIVNINDGDKSETTISYYDIIGNLYNQLSYYTYNGNMYNMEMCNMKTYSIDNEVYRYNIKQSYLISYLDCEYEKTLELAFYNDGFAKECSRLTKQYQAKDCTIKVLEHVANGKSFSVLINNYIFSPSVCIIKPRYDYNPFFDNLPVIANAEELVYENGLVKSINLGIIGNSGNNLYIDFKNDELNMYHIIDDEIFNVVTVKG